MPDTTPNTAAAGGKGSLMRTLRRTAPVALGGLMLVASAYYQTSNDPVVKEQFLDSLYNNLTDEQKRLPETP